MDDSSSSERSEREKGTVKWKKEIGNTVIKA